MGKKLFIFIIFFYSVSLAQSFQNYNNQISLGKTFLQGTKYKEAKNIFETIYKKQPQNYQLFLLLNESYLKLKLYNSSISLIKNKINLSPSDINLYGLLGSTYYQSGNENKAFKTWDEALSKIKPSYINFRVIANYAIERRAFEKAIEYLNKGKTFTNDPKYFSFDLGNLYAITMQFENATKEYCSILKSDKNQLRIVESRILLYANKPQAYNKIISTLKKCSEQGNSNTIYLLARIYEEGKDYTNAYNTYLKIEKLTNSNGNILLRFANKLFNFKEYNFSGKVYKKIITDFPNSNLLSSAKLGYTKSMGAELWDSIKKDSPIWKPYYKINNRFPKKTEYVISAYKQLIKDFNSAIIKDEAYFRIGEINLKIKKNYAEAILNFSKVIKNHQYSKYTSDAFMLRGQAFIQNGELEKAYSNFKKMIIDRRIINEKKIAAKFQMAKILFYKGDFSKSSVLLGQITNYNKNDFSNDALELSLLISTTKSDSIHLSEFAKTEFLINQNKYDSAYTLLKNIYVNTGTNFVLKSYAKFRFAQVEIAIDSLTNSLVTLSEIIKEEKRNIYADNAVFLKAKIYEFGIHKYAAAVLMYKKLLKNYPYSLYIDAARKAIVQITKK